MQMNDRGLYDIYGMHYIPFWQTNAFFWGILTFSILVVCSVIMLFLKYYWIRRRKKTSPWQSALNQLDELVITESLSSTDIKRYYFALTNSMKTYMSIRYDWDVTHLTDKECVEFFAKSDLDSTLKEPLCKLFDDAILIKFADQQVAGLLLKNYIDSMRGVIYATIPNKNIKISSR